MNFSKIELDPKKLHVMNNYALVEFIDDDIEKSKTIIIVKQNNSTKLRSQYVGKVLDRPDTIKGNLAGTYELNLSNIEKGKTIVAYDPRSIELESNWEGKRYHVIRAEDIYCILDGYKRSEVKK